MRSCLDPQDGLIPTLLDKHAEILQRPRGCAMSWMLAFMPQFAPTFAKEQYARYSRTWSISALGMQFFREWPTGSWDVIDSDSGLVVGDAGMAATGVGIAATRANRDFYSCQRQQRAVEYLGLPTWSLAGEKTYFLRRLLVADVLALWGKTITSWRPKVSETSNSLKRIDHQTTNDSWMNLVSFAGIAVLILAFSIWMLRKRLREFRARKPIWSKLTVCCFSLQLAASLLYIFFSDFILLAAMAILTVIEACFLHLLPFLSWFGLNR